MSVRVAAQRWPVALRLVLCVGSLLAGALHARAQTNLRLLLSTGTGVPEHPGFVFGPFSHLAMNEGKQVVFLSSLQSVRSELRAVVRSEGVSFAVVAFQGLRSPVRGATYESFSAPSINNAGVIAFTVGLRGEGSLAAVIRMEGNAARALVVTGDPVPGVPEATFIEFSAPLVNSAGNVLFGARTNGKRPSSGLYLWGGEGIRAVVMPPELRLGPRDLLEPIFFSHDEAVFVPRGTPTDAAIEQFFRAVARRALEESCTSPGGADVVEVLAPRAGQPATRLLLVMAEGDEVRTMALKGDPAQPVLAKRSPALPALRLGRVLAQAAGPRGNILFAAVPADDPADLALYCFCEGQVLRMTSREDFQSLLQAVAATPIVSLTCDSRHTAVFIAPTTDLPDSQAIFVASLP